jgi:hypothetical protein
VTAGICCSQLQGICIDTILAEAGSLWCLL